MWSNSTRKILIGSIYEYLFWHEFETAQKFSIDWEQLKSTYYVEGGVLRVSSLNKLYKKFEKNSMHYKEVIQEYSTDWSKTYNLVKAILIVFVLELEEYESKSEKSLLNKYIRITQDLVGGESPSLVHAISNKIYENFNKI